jgi:RNA-directed DNA polymerase
MQESYGEGVAIHTGPELCGVSREAGHEALVGVRAGRVLSPEISQSGVPTLSPCAEGNTASSASASWTRTPRGQRPRACTDTPRTRTGRSQVSPGGPVVGRALERSGKSEDARR